jgi:hypothetical protein
MSPSLFDIEFKKLHEKLEKKNDEYNKKIQIEILKLQSGKFEKNKNDEYAYIKKLKNQIIQLENEKLHNNKPSKVKIANYYCDNEYELVSDTNKIKTKNKWTRFMCFFKF